MEILSSGYVVLASGTASVALLLTGHLATGLATSAGFWLAFSWFLQGLLVGMKEFVVGEEEKKPFLLAGGGSSTRRSAAMMYREDEPYDFHGAGYGRRPESVSSIVNPLFPSLCYEQSC